MKKYNIPEELTKVREALLSDPMKDYKVIDSAIPELSRGVWGIRTTELYRALASNSFIYKEVDTDFEDWLAMLTNAELALISIMNNKDYAVMRESDKGMTKTIDYNGFSGILNYDVDACHFRLQLGKQKYYFDIPGLPLNHDIFSQVPFLNRLRTLVEDATAVTLAAS